MKKKPLIEKNNRKITSRNYFIVIIVSILTIALVLYIRSFIITYRANISSVSIFIDNTKSFFKQTNIDGKELLKSFEKREEFKMMKLLRDFGQHFSIPINDLSVSTNFSTNT